jgi:hypothetical protein
MALVFAGCSSGSSTTDGINASIERVERQLPRGSNRVNTKTGSNYRVDTYRLPSAAQTSAAGLAAAHLPGLTMGTPTFAGPVQRVLDFKGDASCDGVYQVTFVWAPKAPRMATISANCED